MNKPTHIAAAAGTMAPALAALKAIGYVVSLESAPRGDRRATESPEIS
jgi:hypothetical protein